MQELQAVISDKVIAMRERIMQDTNAKRPFESTKATIIEKFNEKGDEEGCIWLESHKISLTCPVLRTPIKLPARGKNCSHLQCFDLTNYLAMNDQCDAWKCPICDDYVPSSDLVIDEYFQKMIESKPAGSSIKEFRLMKDGSWADGKEIEVVDLLD